MDMNPIILIEELNQKIKNLEDQLTKIRFHWQDGVDPSSLYKSWYYKMAELVGDEEGLNEYKNESKQLKEE